MRVGKRFGHRKVALKSQPILGAGTPDSFKTHQILFPARFVPCFATNFIRLRAGRSGLIARPRGGTKMANPNPNQERIPAMQHLLENPFLLLFLGIAMPTVIYIVWGVMEIVNIPIAK
jgi:hypothetical protein